jgi:hypothetical protein
MCFKRGMSEWHLRRRSDPLNVERINLFGGISFERGLTLQAPGIRIAKATCQPLQESWSA